MAGVPLLNGFLSKEMFFAQTVYIESLPWIEFGLPLAATLAGFFAVVYSLRFSVDIFFGPLSDGPAATSPGSGEAGCGYPSSFLVLGCLIVGILPAWSVGPVLGVGGPPRGWRDLPAYSLALWHGFNLPLADEPRGHDRRSPALRTPATPYRTWRAQACAPDPSA